MIRIKKLLKELPLTRPLYFSLLRKWQMYLVARDRKRLQKYGFEIVRRMQDVMNGRFCCHVDFGTMLGLVRDGGFMPWDDDMDFSVTLSQSDTPAAILRLLLENGFDYLSCYEYDNRIEQIAVSYKGLRVDVFLQRLAEDGSSMCLDFLKKNGGVYSNDYALTAYLNKSPRAIGCLVKIIQGVEVVLPTNFEDILAAEYGDAWRVQNPNWDLATGTKYPRVELPGEGYCLVPVERVYELG